MTDTYARTLFKTLTWRIFATGLTILILYFFTGDLAFSGEAGILINIGKGCAYYLHERLYMKIKWGTDAANPKDKGTSIVDWIRFTRIHTACLTMAGCLIGYVLAGGSMLSWGALTWAVWALLFHAGGFAHNNLCDYKYDLKDPSKQHFPHVSGKISFNCARNVTWGLIIIVILTGVWLTKLNGVAVIFFMSAVGFGLLYNYTCKRTMLSPLWITASFTSIPLIPYFTYTSSLSLIMGLVAVYTVFLMMFQIAVEGYYKDMGADKVNLLLRLGSTFKDGVYTPSLGTQIFGWGLRIPNMLLAFLILGATGWPIPYIILTMVFMFLIVGTAGKVLSENDFNKLSRSTVTKRCASVEIVTYFALVSALGAILDWCGVALLILFPIIWFTVLNRVMWGRGWGLSPKV